MTDDRQPYEKAIALAALSGMKLALGPALLSAARRRPETGNWVMAAMGEMALDAIGLFPARHRPAMLLPHALAGAYVAHESLKEEGNDDPMVLAAGAAVAAGVAMACPVVRFFGEKVLGLPHIALSLAEAYLALKLGSQAAGVPMEQMGEEARAALDRIKEQAAPLFEQLRQQAMPMVQNMAERAGVSLPGVGNGASTGAGAGI